MTDNQTMKIENLTNGVRKRDFVRMTSEVVPKKTMHPTTPVLMVPLLGRRAAQ